MGRGDLRRAGSRPEAHVRHGRAAADRRHHGHRRGPLAHVLRPRRHRTVRGPPAHHRLDRRSRGHGRARERRPVRRCRRPQGPGRSCPARAPPASPGSPAPAGSGRRWAGPPRSPSTAASSEHRGGHEPAGGAGRRARRPGGRLDHPVVGPRPQRRDRALGAAPLPRGASDRPHRRCARPHLVGHGPARRPPRGGRSRAALGRRRQPCDHRRAHRDAAGARRRRSPTPGPRRSTAPSTPSPPPSVAPSPRWPARWWPASSRPSASTRGSAVCATPKAAAEPKAAAP